MPKSQFQYEIDAKECKSEAHQRHLDSALSSDGIAKSAFIGMFGLAGAGLVGVTDDSDYERGENSMADECMKKLGYKLK